MRKTSGQLKPKSAIISAEMEKQILVYFKSTKDNRTTEVAKHFGVSPHQVSRILDVYFDKTRQKIYESHKSKEKT